MILLLLLLYWLLVTAHIYVGSINLFFAVIADLRDTYWCISQKVIFRL